MEVINSKALRDAMIKKCLGVSELAKQAGLTAVTISNILKADSPCRLPTIAKLAKALDVAPTSLILS